MKRLKLLCLISFLFLASCSSSDESDMRIISLIPSNTEIINELMGTDQLVGVTDADNYPESLEDSDIEKINTFEFDPETLIALKPTHIVSHESINTLSQDKLDQVLEATDAELLVVPDATNVEDIYTSIDQIGEFLNVEDKSKDVVQKMKKQHDDLINDYQDTKLKSLFVLLSPSPDFYVVGENTFMNNMLEDINIENVFDDLEGYPMVDIEEILDRKPEYVVSGVGSDEEEFNDMIDETKGFENMAFFNKDKQCVPNNDMISRPGPRFIEGMRQVAECVHD